VSWQGPASLIANPVAGRGAAAKLLPDVQARFAEIGIRDVLVTRAEGDEEFLVSRAIARGVKSFAILGGDGTCTRVANAILRSGVDCAVAVVPSGTGNDFAKTLGVLGTTARDVAELVAKGATTRIDVGRADERYFLNSCGFGFAPSVLEATQRVRFLKGDAVYVYSALAQLFTYRGISVSVNSTANADARKMLMLTVSNGRFLGGAFRIAPHASVLDGELDVGFFGDTSLIGRVRIFAGAFRGTHLGLPSVKTASARAMTLRFSAPPMMEVDGELRQAPSSTVKIECVPRALNVIAAPGYPL
jgi:diacylglycerol kinase (ATP)